MLTRNGLPRERNIPSSEITPKDSFFNRRNFVTGAAALGVGALALKQVPGLLHPDAVHADQKLTVVPSKYTVSDTQTPFAKATTYNNYYEFGTDKIRARKERPHPPHPPLDRAGRGHGQKAADLRHRHLMNTARSKAASTAIAASKPGHGHSVGRLLPPRVHQLPCEPLPSAKYVQFLSVSDTRDMPDKPGGFDWPYSEGLRMDEAMNPLCLLTFGCYGEALPNQNGAPVRIVSPWKYGFKSAKSIVKIVFTDKQPRTSWNKSAPGEYGFYSNVNPQVDHPRWSQAHERRIDSSPFPKPSPPSPSTATATR